MLSDKTETQNQTTSEESMPKMSAKQLELKLLEMQKDLDKMKLEVRECDNAHTGSWYTLGLDASLSQLIHAQDLNSGLVHTARIAAVVGGLGYMGWKAVKFVKGRFFNKPAEAAVEVLLGQAAPAGMAAIPVAGFIGAAVLGAASLSGAICSS